MLTLLAALTIAQAPAAPAPPPGYHLAWAEEFERDGPPNPKDWAFERGFVRNREGQWYRPENATCANGLLVIEARRERVPNPRFEADSPDWRRNREFAEYTAASLNTRGRHAFKYGRFEVRARVDARPGLWPAIWTLGVAGEWPSNGEIDIMEVYRGMLLANVAWGTDRRFEAHWDSVRKRLDRFKGPEWARQFHVWRMDWDEREIRLFVDDELLNTTDLYETVNGDAEGRNLFHQEHYLLLNLSVGGDNGGDPSATEFPAHFEVDYVRIYQKD